VNAHVLTEIIVATERLIATWERTRKRLFVGVDTADMALEMFTPGETFPAVGYDADKGPSASVGAIWNNRVWDRRDTSSSTFLG